MTQQVMELAQALGGAGQDEHTLRTLCAAACKALERRLRPGVAPEDCAGAYPLAAAWLALDWLRGSQGLEGITALSAGDLSVRREAGGEARLSQRAMELMGPYLRDEGFVFQGVEG